MINAVIDDLGSKVRMTGDLISICSDIVRLNEAMCECICHEHNITKEDYLEMTGYKAFSSKCLVIKADKITDELRESIKKAMEEYDGEIQIY